MSPSAQGMRVSATVRKQWMQDVAAVVLDTVEQLIVRVFDQIGGRRPSAANLLNFYPRAQNVHAAFL